MQCKLRIEKLSITENYKYLSQILKDLKYLKNVWSCNDNAALDNYVIGDKNNNANALKGALHETFTMSLLFNEGCQYIGKRTGRQGFDIVYIDSRDKDVWIAECKYVNRSHKEALQKTIESVSGKDHSYEFSNVQLNEKRFIKENAEIKSKIKLSPSEKIKNCINNFRNMNISNLKKFDYTDNPKILKNIISTFNSIDKPNDLKNITLSICSDENDINFFENIESENMPTLIRKKDNPNELVIKGYIEQNFLEHKLSLENKHVNLVVITEPLSKNANDYKEFYLAANEHERDSND